MEEWWYKFDLWRFSGIFLSIISVCPDVTSASKPSGKARSSLYKPFSHAVPFLPGTAALHDIRFIEPSAFFAGFATNLHYQYESP